MTIGIVRPEIICYTVSVTMAFGLPFRLRKGLTNGKITKR